MKWSEKTVSRPFRDWMLERYPALGHLPFAKLLAYVLWGSHYDENSGRLILDSGDLAYMDGQHDAWKNENYSATKFLNDFQGATGIKFQLAPHSSFRGKSRELIRAVFPADVQQAVEQEDHNFWALEKRVYFASGRAFSPATQRKQREEERNAALEAMGRAGNEDVILLGNLLNNAAPNRFTAAVNANIRDAVNTALDIQYVPASNYNIKLLMALRDQPQPYYAPSRKGRTVRLFGNNLSMLGLTKRVRQALCRGWIESDLRSAQLAIIAREWNVTSVIDLLETNASIWDYILLEMGLDPQNDDHKPVVKNALYAAIFGRQEGAVGYFLTRESQIKGLGNRFRRIPMMQDLFAAREERMQEIRAAGGAATVYDHWLSTDEFPVDSILAQCAQAKELMILSPVIRLAAEVKESVSGFSLILWQHDGFSWIPHKAEDRDHWMSRLGEVVDSQANEMGILTRLDHKIL